MPSGPMKSRISHAVEDTTRLPQEKTSAWAESLLRSTSIELRRRWNLRCPVSNSLVRPRLSQLDLVDTHGGLTAHKYIDGILRLHVEPHIDDHVLADRAVFMQDEASPHTARISQEFLANAAIDVLLCQQRARIYQYHWEHMVAYIQTHQR